MFSGKLFQLNDLFCPKIHVVTGRCINYLANQLLNRLCYWYDHWFRYTQAFYDQGFNLALATKKHQYFIDRGQAFGFIKNERPKQWEHRKWAEWHCYSVPVFLIHPGPNELYQSEIFHKFSANRSMRVYSTEEASNNGLFLLSVPPNLKLETHLISYSHSTSLTGSS